MHWFDWLIVVLPLLLMLYAGSVARRKTKSVADFMAASRCAGRYLICNARGEAGFGAISAIGGFQAMALSGLTLAWWGLVSAPVGLLMTLTGFVFYRYRETRVLTLSQFFEVRYNKSFRVLSGTVSFLSGLFNYGIFPGVSANFLVYFCGLPERVPLLGASVPTFALIMAGGLTIALLMTLTGGQLTVMVNDCVLGLVSGLLYVVIAIALLRLFDWGQISYALSSPDLHAPGQSLLNPFDSGGLKSFNLWYVLIGIGIGIYSTGTWQGGHAFNASAANPHEAKMGGILGCWRGYGLGLMVTLLGCCGYTYLVHPDFASGASQVKIALANISDSNVRDQMSIPLSLSHFLPIGIKGALCSVMLYAWLAVDSSYLHSWGSIFVQDMILPLRRKPLSPTAHIWLLRGAIAAVALFGFVFSLFFANAKFILMFFAITGALYTAGAGASLLGGLYWKKGTAAAAWSSMCVGMTLATVGILLDKIPGDTLRALPLLGGALAWVAGHADQQVLACFATAAAALTYVVVSLATCKQDFDMDRLLHRGVYAVADEHKKIAPTTVHRRFSVQSFLGIDAEFTTGDKLLSIGLFAWSMSWFSVFAIGTAWNLLGRLPAEMRPAWIQPWTTAAWSSFWHWYAVLIPLGMAIVTTVWFTWGGVRDLRRLFHSLATVKRNEADDGTVINHHNAGE